MAKFHGYKALVLGNTAHITRQNWLDTWYRKRYKNFEHNHAVRGKTTDAQGNACGARCITSVFNSATDSLPLTVLVLSPIMTCNKRARLKFCQPADGKSAFELAGVSRAVWIHSISLDLQSIQKSHDTALMNWVHQRPMSSKLRFDRWEEWGERSYKPC
jgi:hypothetical protein